MNPANINDISVFKTDLQMLIGVLKCNKDKEKLKNYVLGHSEYFSNVDYDTANVYEEFLKIGNLTTKKYIKKEGSDVCTAIRDMYDSAVKEGQKEGQVLSVVNLITKGKLSLQDGAEELNISVEELKAKLV